MNRIVISSLLVLSAIHLYLNPLQGQIAFSPSFVFLDSKSGVGDLLVTNNGNKTYEVRISLSFGYPTSDSLGNFTMNYADTLAYHQFALDPRIRYFPHAFLLPPGKQRTVRMQLNPSEKKKEGFFFTRVKIFATPTASPVSETPTEEISTHLTFNFEQITAVFYHSGKVRTGLDLQKLEANQQDSVLHLLLRLHRTGDSPFLGTLHARIKDDAGKVLAESRTTISVYFDFTRTLDLPLKGVPPGKYVLALSFETKRNDMLPQDPVQAPTKVHESAIEIRSFDDK
ncbi:MAG TPA: hypothetical protein PKG48_07625 [Bacteroidales bacterium]|nr:hypothetical protein [Bacteroidales bacterium]